MSTNPVGISFEDEIREFLHKLGFCDVPAYGAARETFELGGQEIDAFGRLNNLYFVIDARTAISPRGRGDGIQARLESINGYKQMVIEDIRERFESLHGYRDCIFVFWTKNKKITDQHKTLARRFHIALRDEFDLLYYSKALRLLESQEIVRNSLLEDLSLQLGSNLFIEGSPVSVSAIRTMAGSKKFYTFLIEVRHLLKFSYVFRVETNNILASYQRLLNPSKIRRIRQYLRQQGYFANNVLVATDADLQLDEENEDRSILIGSLSLPDKPCYLEIIDGQHRLLAYSNLPGLQNHCLGVTVISNLSQIERAKLFVLVNREQTKVPHYLLWDLYTLIEPNGLRGRISTFVQSLSQDGPLKDLIKLPRVRSPTAYLSFANLCQSFYKRTSLYSRYSRNAAFLDVVESLFRIVREDDFLSEDWSRSVANRGKLGFVCTNNALAIQIYLLSKILRKRDEQGISFPTSNQIDNWREYLVDRIVEPLRQYFNDNADLSNSEDSYGLLRKRTSNEAERSEAANAIFDLIEF
jgi:DGQHR domain-containing protein